MKYTRESLYIGFRFISYGSELEITSISDGDDYEAIIYDKHGSKVETLSISYLLKLLNNGDRKEIKKELAYEIY